MARAFTGEEFESQVRQVLEPRYIDKHPLMQSFYKGRLTKKQVRAWIVNRFYLQNSIGSKDAAILSNCPIPEVRRIWISRTLRREGMGGSVGDVDGWLTLAEAAGLKRDKVVKARCLPGVRFAVNDLVNFARRAEWLAGVSTSLYEILAKQELVKRVDAFKTHYRWVRPEGLKFFMSRLANLDRDSESTMSLIATYATNRHAQDGALKAATYMCEVVWNIHDAVYMEYVIRDSPLSISL